MATMTNQMSLNGIGQMAYTDGDGVRAAQSVLLSELPGVMFAVLTLAYVVVSFAGVF